MPVFEGTSGADLINGSEGDDTIRGREGDDVINGHDGNDTIGGDGGADAINGGGGDDFLTGHAGDDFLQGGEGNDVLDAGVGVDFGQGGYGYDQLYGGAGNDMLYSRDGRDGDRLFAGEGDDYLEIDSDFADAGAGADRVSLGRNSVSTGSQVTLGSGADQLIANSHRVGATFAGGRYDRILDFNAAEGDLIFLGQANRYQQPLVYRGALDNPIFTLTAGEAFSSQDLGGSFTQLWTWTYQNRTFLIIDLDGTGTLGDADFVLQFDNVSGLAREAFDNGAFGSVTTGTSVADIYEGTDLRDQYFGLDGNDLLNGHGQNDTLHGNNGDDRIDGGAGNDTLYGEAGDDVIFGSDGWDTLRGSTGADELHGGDGNDNIQGGGYLVSDEEPHTVLNRIYGEGGDDQIGGSGELYGGAGRDSVAGAGRLYGGDGDDAINVSSHAGTIAWGEAGDDSIRGQQQHDELYGGQGEDFLQGDQGNDRLFGEDDDDNLHGDYGDDLLFGGAGNDRLYGGFGTDNLYGGDGDDELFPNGDGGLLDGGAGFDTAWLGQVQFSRSMGVVVDLEAGVVTGEESATLRSIEGVVATWREDELRGSSVANRLFAAEGDDLVLGLGGDDFLDGGHDDDRLEGGDGADTLRGNEGDDILIGGEGADVFDMYVFPNSGKATDRILDFVSGVDRIHLPLGVSSYVFERTATGAQILWSGGSIIVEGTIELSDIDHPLTPGGPHDGTFSSSKTIFSDALVLPGQLDDSGPLVLVWPDDGGPMPDPGAPLEPLRTELHERGLCIVSGAGVERLTDWLV